MDCLPGDRARRWNPDRADITAYAWDLDHIERTNRWEILPIDRNGLGPAIRQPLKDTTGTVVLWPVPKVMPPGLTTMSGKCTR